MRKIKVSRYLTLSLARRYSTSSSSSRSLRMNKNVKAAIIQFHSSSMNPEENQTKAERYVKEAAGNGAEFVLLPELYQTMLPANLMKENSHSIPGELSNRWAKVAKENKIWLLAGSVLESEAGNEKLYNAATLFNSLGELVHKYRKIHTFDINIPNKITFRESDSIASGSHTKNTQDPQQSNLRVIDSPFGRIGVAICYDLRFPEVFRELSSQSMDILCLPAAFSLPTGKMGHWKSLLVARAIENQCFVLAPDQVLQAANKFNCYGHSLAVEPSGNILAEGDENKEQIIYVDLNLESLSKIREEIPSLKHRKF